MAAVAIGLLVGLLCTTQVGTTPGTDFEFWWRATRHWLAGGDPYALRPGTAEWPLPDPLFYPLPALLLTLPVAKLPIAAASGTMVGGGTAMLAWAITREGLWRLWLLALPGVVIAAEVGQWSPLLMAGALLPWASPFLAAKPTLGLALWLWRPSWQAAAGVAVIGLVSLALRPDWPLAWRANLDHVVSHPAPIATLAGPVLLLAILRWRQPEARLLLAMACVPQLLYFADQLPLGLVARTRREAVALAGCGLAALFGWFITFDRSSPYVVQATPWVLAGCYLPALVVVLRRPNNGSVPGWLDALARRGISLARVRRDEPGSRSPASTEH